jgi:hypothetical protein
MFDVLFTLNRCDCRGMLLIINKQFYTVLFGKPVYESRTMLVDTANKIAGDPNVKRTAWSARQNIDAICFMPDFSMDCRVKPGNDKWKSDGTYPVYSKICMP